MGGIPLPLGTAIKVGATSGAGALAAGARGAAQGAFGAVATAISAAAGPAGILIGGLATLASLLATKTPKPPLDILSPLRVLQDEIAKGTPNSARAVEAERLFETRRQGLVAEAGTRSRTLDEIAAVPNLLGGVAGRRARARTLATGSRADVQAQIDALRSTRTTLRNRASVAQQIAALENQLATASFPGDVVDLPTRQIEAVNRQIQAFGDLSARDILRSVDILPGEGSFGLLPLGSIVPIESKRQALTGAPDPSIELPPTLAPSDLTRFVDTTLAQASARGRSNVSGIGLRRLQPGGAQEQIAEQFLGVTIDPDFEAREDRDLIRRRAAERAETGQSRRELLRAEAAQRDAATQAEIDSVSPTTQEGGNIMPSLTGLFEGLTSLVTAATPITNQIVASKFPTVQPQSQLPIILTSGGGAGGFGQLGNTGGFDPRFVQQTNFPDLNPLFDFAPQGTQGAGGMVRPPFRVTSAGQQVAQPFSMRKANGNEEWFIPAGRPTAFTKASRKTRRRCRPR